MASYNLAKIEALLIEAFTDEELRRFCYDAPAFKPVYERLSGGAPKAQVITLLINYADQQSELETLLNWAETNNPTAYEKHHPYDTASTSVPEPITPLSPADPVAANDKARAATEKITFSYPLRIFLCHASEDKAVVRELYNRLQADGLKPWLDEIDLLPGQVWRHEIPEAIRASDVILVCVSNNATTKEGYIRDEIAYALDVAEQQPRGTIFFIPVKLEECQVPERLSRWQWVDLFEETGYERLTRALQVRAQSFQKGIDLKGRLLRAARDPIWQMIGVIIAIVALGWSVYTVLPSASSSTRTPRPTNMSSSLSASITDTKRVSMVLVPAGPFIMGSEDGDDDESPEHTITLDAFYIDQYEVTNARYKACEDDGSCEPPGRTSSRTRESYYGNPEYDDYPVIWVSWYQAKTYCEWREGRLPTEAEWEKVARGTAGQTYPWGEEAPNSTLANYGGNEGDPVPVGSYPAGVSPYGAYDMAGNVWEWVQSEFRDYPYRAGDGRENLDSTNVSMLRGGGWYGFIADLRAANRFNNGPFFRDDDIGFRCVVESGN